MLLEPRSYQKSIYNSIISNGNTLVVLPTGLGKTLIALLLIENRMKSGRCLFLTPTKPLAKQHHKSTIEILQIPESDVALVNGEINPTERSSLYKSAKIIVSTPQTIKNDLAKNILEPDFSLVIFDECHRSVGDYAYTEVAQKLFNEKTLFVGLTASPGGNKNRIKEVMDALKIINVEIRTIDDPDVSPYVQKTKTTWIPVLLTPHFAQLKSHLDSLTSSYARKMGAMGFPPPIKHKGLFLQMRNRLSNLNSNIKFPLLMNYFALLHILHMTELLETQGIIPLRDYLEKLKSKESKSVSMLLKEPLMADIESLSKKDEDHPKMNVLVERLLELKGKKVIVFVQYRSQISHIEKVLNENGISAQKFVGKKDGVTKKIQEQTIADFREGKFDVLVASSIGEEGLDIPSVDVVLFYEPVPSEIRSIQRRGRAARLKEGEVIVLMTKGTRDEAYFYSSKSKESKMKSLVSKMSLNKTSALSSDSKVDSEISKKRAKKEGQMRMSDF